jgi:HSP20 family molecular chaperone IbpA
MPPLFAAHIAAGAPSGSRGDAGAANFLTLEGRKAEKEEKTFLHRGISTRNFKRQFTLADHVEVKGARFENGCCTSNGSARVPRHEAAPHRD